MPPDAETSEESSNNERPDRPLHEEIALSRRSILATIAGAGMAVGYAAGERQSRFETAADDSLYAAGFTSSLTDQKRRDEYVSAPTSAFDKSTLETNELAVVPDDFGIGVKNANGDIEVPNLGSQANPVPAVTTEGIANVYDHIIGSGDDVSDIINNQLSAGESAIIGAAATIDTTIDPPENATIHALREGATLTADATLSTPVLQVNNDGVELKGLHIDASGNTNHCIDVNGAADVDIEKCLLEGATNDNLLLRKAATQSVNVDKVKSRGISGTASNTAGIELTDEVSKVTISNFIVENCPVGIRVAAHATETQAMENITIVGGNIDECLRGIHLSGASSRYLDSVEVSGVTLTSTDTTESAVRVEVADNITLSGITTKGHKHGLFTDQVDVLTVGNFSIDNPDDRGAWIRNGTGEHNIDLTVTGAGIHGAELYLTDKAKITGYFEENQRHGLHVLGSSLALIDGAYFYNNSQDGNNFYADILFDTTSSTHSTENDVLDCKMITDDGSTKSKHAVEEADANQDSNTVKDCRFKGHVSAAVTLSGSDSHARYNDGWATEASGSASVSDTDTIAHGLDETPTYVDLTASADKHIAVATAVGGTNITVGLHDDTGSAVTSDETVYWEAKAR